LPYVEGLLSDDQRAVVEQHLATCAPCSAQVESLTGLVQNLHAHSGAFCPEPWKIFEFLHYGRDPSGAVSIHLDDCETCHQFAESLQAGPSLEAMPRQLWVRVKNQLPGAADPGRPGKTAKPWWRIEGLRDLFRSPAWAVGMAAVAVVLVVILYPREIPQQLIATSAVTWEDVAKPKAFQPGAKRTAIIMSLKDFQPPLSQKRIDSLYTAIAPTMELYERYQIITPATVRDAVKKGAIDPSDRSATLDGLREKMGVTVAVFVTVKSRAEASSIEAELVDAKTGNVIKKLSEPMVADKDLESGIRHAVFNLLQ
jgi:hypothetical protein